MGFDPFVYWEFKQAADNLELAKINVERELIGLPPLMPLWDIITHSVLSPCSFLLQGGLVVYFSLPARRMRTIARAFVSQGVWMSVTRRYIVAKRCATFKPKIVGGRSPFSFPSLPLSLPAPFPCPLLLSPPVCLFVLSSAGLRKNCLTDFYKIWLKGGTQAAEKCR